MEICPSVCCFIRYRHTGIGLGNTTLSNSGSTNAGPHFSNLINKMDRPGQNVTNVVEHQDWLQQTKSILEQHLVLAKAIRKRESDSFLAWNDREVLDRRAVAMRLSGFEASKADMQKQLAELGTLMSTIGAAVVASRQI